MGIVYAVFFNAGLRHYMLASLDVVLRSCLVVLVFSLAPCAVLVLVAVCFWCLKVVSRAFAPVFGLHVPSDSCPNANNYTK